MVGRRVTARTSWEPLCGASKSPYFSSSESEMKLLVMTELLDDPRIISKRDNSVNTLPRISPGFIGRHAPGKYLFVKIFILLMPCARLLRGTPVARARLALVRQKAERPRDRRAVTRQTENDWRLLSAIEGNKKMPARVVDDLSKLGGGTWARSGDKWC